MSALPPPSPLPHALKAVAGLGLLALLGSSATAQVITLKDGRSQPSKGVRLQGETVMAKMEPQPGQLVEIGIPLANIAHIEFPEPTQLKEVRDQLSEGKTLQAIATLDGILPGLQTDRAIPGSWWPETALLKVHGLLLSNKASDAEKIVADVEKFAADDETKRAAKVYSAAVIAHGGNHVKAVEMITEVQKEASSERVMAAAAIFKGQSQLELKEWEGALLSFLQIPVFYPDQKQWEARSLYGAGIAYNNLLDTPRAKAAFTELTGKYANSMEAARAKTELERIANLEKTKGESDSGEAAAAETTGS